MFFLFFYPEEVLPRLLARRVPEADAGGDHGVGDDDDDDGDVVDGGLEPALAEGGGPALVAVLVHRDQLPRPMHGRITMNII